MLQHIATIIVKIKTDLTPETVNQIDEPLLTAPCSSQPPCTEVHSTSTYLESHCLQFHPIPRTFVMSWNLRVLHFTVTQTMLQLTLIAKVSLTRSKILPFVLENKPLMFAEIQKFQVTNDLKLEINYRQKTFRYLWWKSRRTPKETMGMQLKLFTTNP